MDRQAAAANLHSWQVELQFYGSDARRSRTGSTRRNSCAKSSRRAIHQRRVAEGAVDARADRATTGPYPTNMRRNVTQGVPGLGIWYMTGRTEQQPERVERDPHRPVLAHRPQRRSRVASAAGFRRDARKLGMQS